LTIEKEIPNTEKSYENFTVNQIDTPQSYIKDFQVKNKENNNFVHISTLINIPKNQKTLTLSYHYDIRNVFSIGNDGSNGKS